jgi:hypothetical protein
MPPRLVLRSAVRAACFVLGWVSTQVLTAAGLIDQLRTAGIIVTYDPDTRTIRTSDSAAVAIGQDR